MKYPIVIQGEWIQLVYEEANTREEALINAASRWVNAGNEDNDDPRYMLRLHPDGPTGGGTPNLELIVQEPRFVVNPEIPPDGWRHELGIPLEIQDGWRTESTWTIPDVP